MGRLISCVALALAAAACVHEDDHPAVTAQASDSNVVVRAEFGRVWWSRCAWSEPHELWALPDAASVEDLRVSKIDSGYVVTFHQRGREWRGTFNPDPKHAESGALARD